MNAHAKLVADKLRFAARLIAEAREVAGAADLDPEFAVQLLALQEPLAAALLSAMTAAGPDYVEQLQYASHRTSGILIGDLIGRVLQMPTPHLEALAVDPMFVYRAVAQKAIEIRQILDGAGVVPLQPAEPLALERSAG